MSTPSIAAVAIGLALFAVLVIGLLTYLSGLMRKAYELKVELDTKLDLRLAQIEDDVAARAKRLRKEVQEDVAKMRDGVLREAEQRGAAFAAEALDQVAVLREQADAGRAADAQAVEDLRRRHQELQRALEALRRDLVRLGAAPEAMPSAMPEGR